MASRKRHRGSVHSLESSSEDEASLQNEVTPRRKTRKSATSTENASRSSERLKQKRSKTFRLPSRDDQWNAIQSEKICPAKLSQLKPRKLVNNLTKVTHRYNYDPAETSGEESLEDFINDSPSASDSDSPSEPIQKTPHRIRGYRPRISQIESDTSDEEKSNHDTLSKSNTDTNQKKSTLRRKSSSHKQDQQQAGTGVSGLNTTDGSNSEEISPQKGRKTKSQAALTSDKEEEHSEDDKMPEKVRKTKSQAVLASDEEDENSEDGITPQKVGKTKREAVLDSDEEDENVEQKNLDGSGETEQGKNVSQCIKKECQENETENVNPSSLLPSNSEEAVSLDGNPSGPGAKRINLEPGEATSAMEGCSETIVVKTEPGEGTSEKGDCSGRKTARFEPTETTSGEVCSRSTGVNTKIEVSDSESDSPYTDDESSDNDVGRIQKLAARKKKEHDRTFGKLMEARAKRLKSSEKVSAKTTPVNVKPEPP